MSPVWIVSSVLAWVVIALLVVVVLSLLRQLGALRAELAAGGLPENGPARLYDDVPPFTAPLVGADGELALGGEDGPPALLVAHEPGCTSCAEIEPALTALIADAALEVRLVSVLALDPQRAAAHRGAHPLGTVATVTLDALPDGLRPASVPAAVGIGRDGVVCVTGRPRTADELREAVRATAAAVVTGVPGSQRVTRWGVCAPFFD